MRIKTLKIEFYKYIKGGFAMGILLLSITSCNKTEFMPEPVGAAIPVQEGPSVTAALTTSSNILFKVAWERSNMDQVLKQEALKFKVTIFVPSDEAMTKAGFTASVIAQTDPKVLMALMRYHVVRGEVTINSLASASGQSFNTMLTNPDFVEGIKSGAYEMVSVPYTYRQYLDTDGGSLMVNGKKVTAGKEINIANGLLLPIGTVLDYPKKQMFEALQADGRFKLYLEAIAISKGLYDSMLLETFAAPIPGSMRYWMDANAHSPGSFLPPRRSDLLRLTCFAPTDEAFHKAGIYSAADFVALNEQDPYNGYNSVPTDLLLKLHIQGFAEPNLEIDWDNFETNPGAASYVIAIGGKANMSFYSNVLNPQYLGNYVTSTNGEGGTYTYLDLEFGKDSGGKITVKQKGAVSEPASIIEEDINTLQGPIHVVNRLIIPKDFKLR